MKICGKCGKIVSAGHHENAVRKISEAAMKRIIKF
jgi:hypothetical protein